MHPTPLSRYAREALSDGIGQLLSQQSDDGFWRDYNLVPGMSEAWSTAWVGWCLAQAGPEFKLCGPLQRCARALAACRRNDGWGYNRTTGSDADSTAWVLRFLSLLGCEFGTGYVSCLQQFLDVHGRAHTFLEPDAGCWGGAHADVTPMVGLALKAIHAPSTAISLARNAAVRARNSGGVWSSFWWPTEAYATAWSVEFLRQSGGVPDPVRRDITTWLQTECEIPNAFEMSLRLLTASSLRLSEKEFAAIFVEQLLDLQIARQGWAPAALLRVPDKTDAGNAKLHADSNGLMTTALASAALASWLR